MAAGLLRGMKHREQDLDTATLFLFCGLDVALMGFILRVRVAIPTRRKG